jgi:hypothetical protein
VAKAAGKRRDGKARGRRKRGSRGARETRRLRSKRREGGKRTAASPGLRCGSRGLWLPLRSSTSGARDPGGMGGRARRNEPRLSRRGEGGRARASEGERAKSLGLCETGCAKERGERAEGEKIEEEKNLAFFSLAPILRPEREHRSFEERLVFSPSSLFLLSRSRKPREIQVAGAPLARRLESFPLSLAGHIVSRPPAKSCRALLLPERVPASWV